MPYFNGMIKPSEQLAEYLMGKTTVEDTPPAIVSWAQKSIHDAAVQILNEPEKGSRRNMLGRVPAAIRPMVEDQVKSLWHKRRSNK